jgi:CBS domain containing-hemolysin-like protein
LHRPLESEVMTELAIAVCLAIGISALCSLSEAVLYSVPFSYIEARSRKGIRAAVLFKRMRENVERPISAILTLNTVANTFGAAVAGAAAVAVFGRESLEIFSAGFTLGILILSEILPKTIGVRHSKGFCQIVAWPVYLLQWLLWPVTWFTSLLTRSFGSSSSLVGITAEEIQVMARMGRRVGALKGMEETVIRNILALRDVRARDIMTPRTVVFSLPKELTLAQVREVSPIWPWPHSRVPVFEGDRDHMVGVAQRRVVLAALADDKTDLRLGDIMTPVHIVPETLEADRLLQQFIERREHLFVVVDEYGGMAGVVSLEDVFEEILGQEIVDESDVAEDLRKIAHQRRRRMLGEREG